jgi:hypothetical protein
MVWKPITLLEFNTETLEWGKRKFELYVDYISFVKSCYKFPGEYNFKNTEYWIEPALKFARDKRYTDYHPASKEYAEHFLLERRKCEQGLIIDNVFISGDMYFFWNYCPIMNKVEMKETFPDIWDGHYHYLLYLELAWLEDEDGGGTKARQKGISLVHMARITKRVWFGQKATLKVIGFEEEYVLGEWGIMQGYRDHINEHTGWYREFNPGEVLNWEQKKEVQEGTTNKRKFFKGNKSKVKGATTKKNMAKAVGGPALEIYATEAGIYQNLKKVKGYVDPNLKMGSVKTGMFTFMGAVGELKDAADLQEFCFNPVAYNIRPVKDTFSGSMDDIAFFFPDEWNYTYKDELSGEIVKCYDKNGNSNLVLAIEFLEKEEQAQKNKDESAYKLWRSQHPRTLQDAFDQREDNPFPTTDLKRREQELLSKKDIIVKLERDAKGKVYHKFSDDVPVTKLRPNPTENNEGAIIIYEFPIDNPPAMLYYAGIDPIVNIDTTTSKSLMSIKILIATHERDGKICPGYEVATYTGRHKNPNQTYQICLDLIEFYNASAVIESNVRDFTDWMIKRGKAGLCMRRRQIVAIGEMMPNSTIADEIGVRMEGEFKKKCLEKTIHYMEEPIADSFNLETGESEVVLGVQRLKDKMMIRECLRWTPKLNTDRLVSWMLAYIAAEGNTNRHVIREVKNGVTPPKPKEKPRSMGSPFRKSVSVSTSKRLSSPFGKR